MGALRRTACPNSSRTSIAAPSAMTKPSRSRSNGRHARPGSSLRVDIARMRSNEPKMSGERGHSTPPASMTSAWPPLIQRNADPMAIGPDEHAAAVPILVLEMQAGILHGLLRRGHRELGEPVQPPGAPGVHVRQRIEVTHLGRDAAAEPVGVEPRDAVHSRPSRPDPVEEPCRAGADGRECPDAGDDDAMHPLTSLQELLHPEQRAAGDPIDEHRTDDDVADEPAHQRPRHDELVVNADAGPVLGLRPEPPLDDHAPGDAREVAEQDAAFRREALLPGPPARGPPPDASAHLEDDGA